MTKLTIYVGLILSAIFLWLAVKDTDLDGVANAFSNANLFAAVLQLVALATFYWLKAIRWSDLLSPTRQIPARQLVPSMMSGAAGNNLLPAHLGEIVRMYLLAREHEIAKSTVLATLVVERLLDIISVLALLTISFVMSDLTQELKIAGLFLGSLAVIALGFSFMFLRHTSACIRFVSRLLQFLPSNLRQKIEAQLQHIAIGLESLRATHLYGRVLLNSITQWLLMAVCIYSSLWAFSIAVPAHSSLLILGLIVAGLSLPTSPGFVGTIEFCFVLGLQAFDVDANLALSAALFYHTVLWTSVTLTGLFLMRKHHMSWQQLRGLNKTEEESP